MAFELKNIGKKKNLILFGKILIIASSIPVYQIYLFFITIPFILIGNFLLFKHLNSLREKIIWLLIPFITLTLSLLFFNHLGGNYSPSNTIIKKEKLQILVKDNFYGDVAIVSQRGGINIDTIKTEKKIIIPDNGILFIENHVHDLFDYDLVFGQESGSIYNFEKLNKVCRNLNLEYNGKRYSNILIHLQIDKIDLFNDRVQKPISTSSITKLDSQIVKKLDALYIPNEKRNRKKYFQLNQ